MSVNDIAKWLGVAALFLSVGNTLWAFLMRDVKTAASNINKVKDGMIDHDRRIQTIEGELRHIPTRDEVHAIMLGLAELRGTVARVEDSVGSVTRTVRRIDDYLRANKA